MAIAIVVILLIVGSVVFHFMTPWWFTPIASNWGAIDDMIDLTFWVTGIVLIAVNLFMAYCIIRYRYRKTRRAVYQPENTKLELWLTGLTTLGVVALLAPGLVIWNQFVTVPEEAYVVEAVGQQWQWTFRFAGADDVLGTVDTRHVSIDNPFGINPDDPNGRDDILIESNEVHLPIDRPVKVLLRSIDVLHDFYVPQIRAKMDMVPGSVSYIWFTPIRTGTFEILCAELCGIGHYAMRGLLVVDEENAYQAWLQAQPTFAQTLAEAGSGRQLAQAEGFDPNVRPYTVSDQELGALMTYLRSDLERGPSGASEERNQMTRLKPIAYKEKIAKRVF